MSVKEIIMSVAQLQAQAVQDAASFFVTRREAGRITTVGSDGSFSQTDLGHWARVREARLRGQSFYPDAWDASHRLVGRTLHERDSGKAWVVEKARREWHAGNVEVALLRDENGSHATYVVANHSSLALDFIEGHRRFLDTFGEQALA